MFQEVERDFDVAGSLAVATAAGIKLRPVAEL